MVAIGLHLSIIAPSGHSFDCDAEFGSFVGHLLGLNHVDDPTHLRYEMLTIRPHMELGT
jgi:hypothetical protein